MKIILIVILLKGLHGYLYKINANLSKAFVILNTVQKSSVMRKVLNLRHLFTQLLFTYIFSHNLCIEMAHHKFFQSNLSNNFDIVCCTALISIHYHVIGFKCQVVLNYFFIMLIWFTFKWFLNFWIFYDAFVRTDHRWLFSQPTLAKFSIRLAHWFCANTVSIRVGYLLTGYQFALTLRWIVQTITKSSAAGAPCIWNVNSVSYCS